MQAREIRGNIPQNGIVVNFFEREIMKTIVFLYKLYLHMFALCGFVAMYAVMCIWAANGGVKLPFMGETMSLIFRVIALGN